MNLILIALVVLLVPFMNAQVSSNPPTVISPVGAPVASASTITPTGALFSISGTNTISTINLPQNYSATGGGCIDMLATGTWSTTTGGNIAAVMNAVAGIEYRACWFGTTWSIK